MDDLGRVEKAFSLAVLPPSGIKLKTLTEAEIAAKLKEILGWKRSGDAIERTWTFDTFVEAVAFMNRVFALAEDANHHPDLTNSWATVALRFTTHDAGGLTDRDFKIAAKVNKIG